MFGILHLSVYTFETIVGWVEPRPWRGYVGLRYVADIMF